MSGSSLVFDFTADSLVVNLDARDWCKIPYPRHPKGCPNYGHKEVCPPTAPIIFDFIDTKLPMRLVAVEFDLAAHIRRMLIRHPRWTEPQTRNVLYWQGSVNKRLRISCERYKIPGTVVTLCPEAMGVNVLQTAKNLGIPIESRPKFKVFKIALMGWPTKE